MVNLRGMLTRTATALPSRCAGLKTHFFSASTAGSVNAGLVAFSTLVSSTWPDVSIRQLTRTMPLMCWRRMSEGKTGATVLTGTGASKSARAAGAAAKAKRQRTRTAYFIGNHCVHRRSPVKIKRIMGLSFTLPESAAARRVRHVFGAFTLAVVFTGAAAATIAAHSHGAPVGLVLGLTAIDLVVGLAGLAWLVHGIEHQHRSLKVSEASLQSQVLARAKELEAANASLRVATKVNSLLALCAQHMPNAVIITDPAGIILWANAAWDRMTGW